MTERIGEQRKAKYAQVIVHIGGYYETQEVPFGVVYQWHPGYLLIEYLPLMLPNQNAVVTLVDEPTSQVCTEASVVPVLPIIGVLGSRLA